MLRRIITIFIVIFLILPVLVVIPVSFSSAQYLTFPPPGFSLKWYQKFFEDPEWLSAALTSFKIGMLTTIASLILGTLASIGLCKSSFKGKNLVQEVFLFPQVMPVIIIAIAIFSFESRLKLIGTTTGLVIAHTVLAIPVVITTIMARLKGLDTNLEYASRSLGAGKVRTFFCIILPDIKSSMISAGLFAFITSFDELIVSLFISGPAVVTLPKRMWQDIRTQIQPTIAAISTMLILTVIIVMTVSAVLSAPRKDKTISLQSKEGN